MEKKPSYPRQKVETDRKERYGIVTVFRCNEAERSSRNDTSNQPRNFTQG
jgi:hypothetical protein